MAAQPLSSGLPSGERSMRWWTRGLRLYLARLACACMASVVCSSIACVPRTGHADERFPIPVHVGAAVPGQRWKATRPDLQRGRPAVQVSPRHPYATTPNGWPHPVATQVLHPAGGNIRRITAAGWLIRQSLGTQLHAHTMAHAHAHRRAHTTNAHARTHARSLARTLARSHARAHAGQRRRSPRPSASTS